MLSSPICAWGRVKSVGSTHIEVAGLAGLARVGDMLRIRTPSQNVHAEVLRVETHSTLATLFSDPGALQVGDRADLVGPAQIAPHDGWLGKIINADGTPAGDPGARDQDQGLPRSILSSPPPAVSRRLLGPRLSTGFMVFDTLLPIRQGQRVGIFAGSGVGKSTLLGKLASNMDTDRVVIGLIGERSREVKEFAEDMLNSDVREKTVIVAATANEAPSRKKGAAYTAMATAEFFRDQGHQVLLIMDSLTRFAEAHRETALLSGEAPALNAFPASTVRVISELVERSGTGMQGQGDITALFSVLVAGSDFEEPIADMVRGILDGHFVLSRQIAERGRYPAVDVGRSVSRALPAAATEQENALINDYKKTVAKYDSLELLLNASMYQFGQDEDGDRAIALHDSLDAFVAERNPGSIEAGFTRLSEILASNAPSALGETAEKKVFSPGR